MFPLKVASSDSVLFQPEQSVALSQSTGCEPADRCHDHSRSLKNLSPSNMHLFPLVYPADRPDADSQESSWSGSSGKKPPPSGGLGGCKERRMMKIHTAQQPPYFLVSGNRMISRPGLNRSHRVGSTRRQSSLQPPESLSPSFLKSFMLRRNEPISVMHFINHRGVSMSFTPPIPHRS